MKKISNIILGIWCAITCFISPIWLVMVFFNVSGLIYKYDYSMDEGTAIILGFVLLGLWILFALLPNIIFMKNMYAMNRNNLVFIIISIVLLFTSSVVSCGKKTIEFFTGDTENHIENNENTLQQETAVEPQTQIYSVPDVKQMEADTVLDETKLNDELIANLFYSEEISEEIKQRIWNISYKENEHISLEELRYLRLLYRGFDGKTHIGELIVNQSIAEDILEIMFELYQNDYLIEKMVLIDEYNGDDEASMEDNNTSAFNYRVIAGTNKLSKHGMGMAIDINPRYNPYVVERASGETIISPKNGANYVDRSKDFSYKLDKDDLCVKLFLEHGFTWGGNWNSVKDYQHFEK